jgi:hypothetical protein
LPFSSRTKRNSTLCPAGASDRDFDVGEGAVAAARGPIAGGLHGSGRISRWVDRMAAADLTESRCTSERGLAMGGGRPAERRFTVGGSGKSVARCHRTVLAYWKFESISLQRRVQCEPDADDFLAAGGAVLAEPLADRAQHVVSGAFGGSNRLS